MLKVNKYLKNIVFFLSRSLHLFFAFGNSCRFEPTCSQYCGEALSELGFFKGGFLSIKRLLRCSPFWGASGFDPVSPDSRPDSRKGCGGLHGV